MSDHPRTQMTGGKKWYQQFCFSTVPRIGVEGLIDIMEYPITEALVVNMGVKRIRTTYSFPYNLITPWGSQYY